MPLILTLRAESNLLADSAQHGYRLDYTVVPVAGLLLHIELCVSHTVLFCMTCWTKMQLASLWFGVSCKKRLPFLSKATLYWVYLQKEKKEYIYILIQNYLPEVILKTFLLFCDKCPKCPF